MKKKNLEIKHDVLIKEVEAHLESRKNIELGKAKEPISRLQREKGNIKAKPKKVERELHRRYADGYPGDGEELAKWVDSYFEASILIIIPKGVVV